MPGVGWRVSLEIFLDKLSEWVIGWGVGREYDGLNEVFVYLRGIKGGTGVEVDVVDVLIGKVVSGELNLLGDEVSA